MKRYRILIVRIGDSDLPHSVSELAMILEDNTGDDVHAIGMWAEDFTERQLPGYHVSEITELG